MEYVYLLLFNGELQCYDSGMLLLRSLKKSPSFYSKTNPMHNISSLFYFVTTLYMFRTVSPSIIRSLRLYIQHHTIQVL